MKYTKTKFLDDQKSNGFLFKIFSFFALMILLISNLAFVNAQDVEPRVVCDTQYDGCIGPMPPFPRTTD